MWPKSFVSLNNVANQDLTVEVMQTAVMDAAMYTSYAWRNPGKGQVRLGYIAVLAEGASWGQFS